MKRSNYDQQKYIAVDGGKDSGDLSFYCFFFLAALISCVGLCVKGSPMEFEREEDEDAPEGRKVYPLFPGMPGYSGE